MPPLWCPILLTQIAASLGSSETSVTSSPQVAALCRFGGWSPSLVGGIPHHMSLGGRQSPLLQQAHVCRPSSHGARVQACGLSSIQALHVPAMCRAVAVPSGAAATSGLWSGCARDKLLWSYLFLLPSRQFCELYSIFSLSLSINTSVFYFPPFYI